MLGKHINNKELYKYQHINFNLPNQRNINLHLIEKQSQKNLEKQNSKTCILYLHGLSSFCLQGTFLVQNLQKYFNQLNVSICLYDLRGHGKDKAPNITFGLKQSQQLYHILSHLKNQKQFQQFILWGRSMGATTILKMISDFSNQLRQNQISIKYLVIDSPFSSFQKIAIQMISTKSGMPKIFSKAIFQYLLSAIQRIHKLKLIVQIQKIPNLQIGSLFLYSSNDKLVNHQHTQTLYAKYPCFKQKIQMAIQHNEQRPDEILCQVFQKIKACLKKENKIERKKSFSVKKIGLQITKNKRIRTVQTTADQDQINCLTDIQNIQKRYKQMHKMNMQQQTKKLLKQVPQQRQNSKQKGFINLNSIKQSPKPYKIAKKDLNNLQNYKDNILLNRKIKESPKVMKQNINKLNFLKFDKKKDKKLKLSHKDLVDSNIPNQAQKSKHRTSIYEHIQRKEQTKYQQRQIKSLKFDFNQFQEVKSTFLIQNQNSNQNVNKILKDTYLKKKYQQKNFNQIRFSINQSQISTPSCCNWAQKQGSFKVLKPQSENITQLSLRNKNYSNKMMNYKPKQGDSLLNQNNNNKGQKNILEINQSNKNQYNKIFFNFSNYDKQKLNAINRLSNMNYV